MKNSIKREVFSWLLVIIFALSLSVVTRTYAFEPRGVRQSSMFPTIEDQDKIFLNKFCYLTGNPVRGDVIVFHPNNNASEDLIKRVIGLPGEWIDVSGSEIYINGKLLDEEFDKSKTNYNQDFSIFDEHSNKGIKLESDEYFVIGDNRDVSMDSRSFGPITRDKIVGKAFFVFWPLDHIGTIK